MPNQINLPAIFVANIMGMAILFCVIISGFRIARIASSDRKLLIVMIVTCALACVADPICFIADGKPGLYGPDGDR